MRDKNVMSIKTDFIYFSSIQEYFYNLLKNSSSTNKDDDSEYFLRNILDPLTIYNTSKYELENKMLQKNIYNDINIVSKYSIVSKTLTCKKCSSKLIATSNIQDRSLD